MARPDELTGSQGSRDLPGLSSTQPAAPEPTRPSGHGRDRARNNSAPALSGPPVAPEPEQHARKPSLLHSLAKPLPQTPPRPDADASRRASRVLPGAIMDPSGRPHAGPDRYLAHMSSSSASSIASSARRDSSAEETRDRLAPRGGAASTPSPATVQGRSPAPAALVGGPSRGSSSAHLSGLMCNVHRTTGREPPPLVGATTTILGDRLYVFGGRVVSRSRSAALTSDLYELDLVRRHWTRVETTGDVPPPRYFHSMCPLGDTKLVCYGGMSPAPPQPQPHEARRPSVDEQAQKTAAATTAAAAAQQPEIAVMSDVHILDVPSARWTYVPAQDAPQGRYAHCACVLPSAAAFTSPRAPLSALQHNPAGRSAHEGRIGVHIDGSGGAEMVVVGGQDGGNHYIEQISVFNLRSLQWTSTQPLGKSCGAYRSVTAPLQPALAARVGRAAASSAREAGSSMLVYSNYNFLDVKLELQVRAPDGTLTERPMAGSYSPPGLRFPNGGVIDTHFVVSGTYLTSSKQEYALWALDLRSLTWSRIDAGGSVFSQGSWNRGVLWNRRNTFVILGNRKRSLVDDYNHRRINFSNVCMVELEAFGFYDNPRRASPKSGFVSASSPYPGAGLGFARRAGYTAGGRAHSRASDELGEKALALRELADMDVLCIGGERIPANSRVVARRWGPYLSSCCARARPPRRRRRPTGRGRRRRAARGARRRRRRTRRATPPMARRLRRRRRRRPTRPPPPPTRPRRRRRRRGGTRRRATTSTRRRSTRRRRRGRCRPGSGRAACTCRTRT